MKPIIVSVDIAAPIDRVFRIASDLPNAADRISGITKLELLTEGPMDVGTRWRETRVMFGREATEVMWVTAFDPPNGYTVEARSHGTHYLTPVTFETIEDGATRMTMSFGATPETLMSRIMMTLFAGMRKTLSKCLLNDLQDIKTACERSEQ